MTLFKKIVCFWFLAVFCGSIVRGQCPQEDIVLETQVQVDSFAIVYPNCTEITGSLRIGVNNFWAESTDIADLSPLNQITSIGDWLFFSRTSLENLNGLENLTFIGGDLHIFANDYLLSLSGLESLTLIGGDFYIDDNDLLSDLGEFVNLTSVEGDLSIISNANLITLNGLENLSSIGWRMEVLSNVNLINLNGLENLTSIGVDLSIGICNNLDNIDGLSNLTTIGRHLRIGSNNNLTSIAGLSNLTSINGELQINNNDNLASLTGIQNIPYYKITNLKINSNPLLSVCTLPPVCQFLLNEVQGFAYISNAPGCILNEVIEACSSQPRIQTNVFYDVNQDKIQNVDEANYYDSSILIQPDNYSYYVQNDGIFYVQPGSYSIIFDELNNPNWQLTTDSASYFVNLEESETDTITFGIYPSQQISDIQASINTPPARCNEIITLNANTKNLGTTVASGTIWLTADDEGPVATFIHQADTAIANTNTYGWYFTDLFPGQSVEKQVNIQVPGPPDFMLGDSLVYEAYVDFEDANGSQSTQAFIYETEVRCSYDPNDKLVNPNREGDYVLFEEDFIYTIRFQNTGNDVAYDVVIRDTLDANLDLTTFRLLGSSHANRLNTILNDDERTLTFEFRDIFLPDSTSNFDASQGYVNYLISPFGGLAEETPITNSAGIYFDLNPPVITNTTQSIMVSELPTVSVEHPDNSFDFNILPNPNKGIFTVEGIPQGIYQILNTSGQIIQEGDIQNDLLIDISREAQGVYFISVTIDNETFVRRMIKM